MSKSYTVEEVKLHNTEDDLWMIIHGKVYDVTSFQEEHPGGADTLLDEAGKDATDAFEDIGHSDDAIEQLEEFYIGELKPSGFFPLSEVEKHNSPEKGLWMAIHGKVYDVTSFPQDHPGGEGPILNHAGEDATEHFERIGHSDAARALLTKYYIGELLPSTSSPSDEPEEKKVATKQEEEEEEKTTTKTTEETTPTKSGCPFVCGEGGCCSIPPIGWVVLAGVVVGIGYYVYARRKGGE